MMLEADRSDLVSNTIILRDSHTTWLLLRRRPITASRLALESQEERLRSVLAILDASIVIDEVGIPTLTASSPIA